MCFVCQAQPEDGASADLQDSKSLPHPTNLAKNLLPPVTRKDCFCSMCGKPFLHLENLIRHMRGHNNQIHPCDLCCLSFTDTDSLNTHKQTHTGPAGLACHVCAQSFSNRWTLTEHFQLHKEYKPYSCSVCGKSYRTSFNLLQHSKVHTQRKADFSCDSCKESFKSAFMLAQHKRVHKLERLKKKRGAKHKAKGDDAIKPIESPYEQRKSRLHVKGGFPCDQCDAIFDHPTTCRRHKMREHSEGQIFPCEDCDAVFRDANLLRKHWNYMHKDKDELKIKRFPCDRCQAAFEKPLWLRWHKTREHSVGPVFPCDECEAAYTSAKSLSDHRYIYHREKRHKVPQWWSELQARKQALAQAPSPPTVQRKRKHKPPADKCFPCNQCDAVFESFLPLRWHKAREHFEGEKFPCNDCEAVYTSIHSLRDHFLNKHKRSEAEEKEAAERKKQRKLEPKHRESYPCKACDLTFSDHRSYLEHRKAEHTVEDESGMQFPCSNCDKRFTSAQGRDKHYLSCTDNKPFACDVCPKR